MRKSARLDLPQGILDVLKRRTLRLGPVHGWAISERIQQISLDVLRVSQDFLYTALHRLETSCLEHHSWMAEASNVGNLVDRSETGTWAHLTIAIGRIPDRALT
jgi:PadR family transcriptional regulator PadR